MLSTIVTRCQVARIAFILFRQKCSCDINHGYVLSCLHYVFFSLAGRGKACFLRGGASIPACMQDTPNLAYTLTSLYVLYYL